MIFTLATMRLPNAQLGARLAAQALVVEPLQPRAGLVAHRGAPGERRRAGLAREPPPGRIEHVRPRRPPEQAPLDRLAGPQAGQAQVGRPRDARGVAGPLDRERDRAPSAAEQFGGEHDRHRDLAGPRLARHAHLHARHGGGARRLRVALAEQSLRLVLLRRRRRQLPRSVEVALAHASANFCTTAREGSSAASSRERTKANAPAAAASTTTAATSGPSGRRRRRRRCTGWSQGAPPRDEEKLERRRLRRRGTNVLVQRPAAPTPRCNADATAGSASRPCPTAWGCCSARSRSWLERRQVAGRQVRDHRRRSCLDACVSRSRPGDGSPSNRYRLPASSASRTPKSAPGVRSQGERTWSDPVVVLLAAGLDPFAASASQRRGGAVDVDVVDEPAGVQVRGVRRVAEAHVGRAGGSCAVRCTYFGSSTKYGVGRRSDHRFVVWGGRRGRCRSRGR